MGRERPGARRDLDRYTDKLARDGRQSECDYAGSLRAQETAADAWERINELKTAQKAQAAA